MRVCIVGNSHLAALKKAWDAQSKEKPDSFDVVFFGSHSGSLRQVGSRDGHFFTPDPDVRRSLSMTSGLDNPELKIGEFDVFLLHALINPNSLSACALHAVSFCEANETSISGSVIRAFVEEHYKGSMLAHMLGIIRASSDAPIVVSPQPYLSRDVIDHPGHASTYADADTLIRLQGKRFFDAFDSVIGEAAIKHSFVFVPQPAETIVSECFTMPQYSIGSVRLSADMSTQHPPDDFSHMNNAYGTLVLRDVMGQISKISPFPAYA